MLENPMVGEMQRELDRRDAADGAAMAAHVDLLTQFLSAGPSTLLPTPAWGKHQRAATMADIVNDEFAGKSGDANLRAFVQVVIDAATKPGVPPEVRMPAMAILSTIGKAYADTHADDYAEQ